MAWKGTNVTGQFDTFASGEPTAYQMPDGSRHVVHLGLLADKRQACSSATARAAAPSGARRR